MGFQLHRKHPRTPTELSGYVARDGDEDSGNRDSGAYDRPTSTASRLPIEGAPLPAGAVCGASGAARRPFRGGRTVPSGLGAAALTAQPAARGVGPRGVAARLHEAPAPCHYKDKSPQQRRGDFKRAETLPVKEVSGSPVPPPAQCFRATRGSATRERASERNDGGFSFVRASRVTIELSRAGETRRCLRLLELGALS